MKIRIVMESLLVFILVNVLTSEGRLIQINRTKVEQSQTDKPNPSIRLTRDIEYALGFSNEETGQDDDFIKSFNKRTKHFFTKKPEQNKSPDHKATRHIRDSNEAFKDHTKKIAPQISAEPKKFKSVLVKKPIPKFNEIDYDDDFQAKMNKFLASAVIDSGDHEDEDFNVDDYDFDVNHDEYAGRGKHLEPRMQTKNIEVTTAKEHKITRKATINTTQPPVKRSANAYKVASKLRDVDYYEEITTKKNKSKDDNDYDESDSLEMDQRNSSVRSIRSWNISRYANAFSGKSASTVSKILSILPLFPQMPTPQELADYPLSYDPNTEMVDLMTGRTFILE